MTRSARFGRISQPLPVPQGHYDDRDETIARRQMEQSFEDLYNVISGLQDDIESLQNVSTDFYYDISTGAVENNDAVNKFGRNPDVDTATDPEDVWDTGGIWVAPTQARKHNIASSDANDDAIGTGAQTIRLYGLVSWDSLETSEDVIMDGLTPVATSNSYVIIHRMKVLTAGSGGLNVGDITATAQTDGTITAQITASQNQTLMAIYGIPALQKLVITKWYTSVNLTSGGGGTADVELLINEEPDNNLLLFLVKHHAGLSSSGSSVFNHEFSPYLSVQGPAIIKVNVESVSSNNTDISGGFDGILITESS